MAGGKYLRKDIPVKGKVSKTTGVNSGKKKLFITILIIILLVILAIALLLGYVWFKLGLMQSDDEIDKSVYASENIFDEDLQEEQEANQQLVDMEGLETVASAPPIPDSEVSEDESVLNVLVIGTDERTKNFNPKSRSDAMILVSINKKLNTVKLVSLERGIAAPILDGQYKGQYDWLTHIFRYGGADLLMQTVEHCFKVNVDHYVRFNFTAVRSVVDVIGGINMNLTESEAWALNNWPDGDLGLPKRLIKGNNRLNGKAALAFARLRSIDSDWQRVQRQRKVILAVVNELKGSTLSKMNDLANEILPMVQTNFEKPEIFDLMFYAPNLLNATFDQMTIPVEGSYKGMTVMEGRGSFAVDYSINNPILHEFLYGEMEE